MRNLNLASNILRALARQKVHEVVLCAGARNAPLVNLLSLSESFKTYSFFEERSAAFFALGRILATGRPVAVITTSGTAAAELLAATIEADYQAMPLVLVTADRPSRFRGSGSPQTIVQPGLFSHYVEKTWDIEGEWNGTLPWSHCRPVHVNVCFDEPLLDGTARAENFHTDALTDLENESHLGQHGNKTPSISSRKPLIVLGGLSPRRAEEILPFLKKWRRPIWAEATSRLRGHPDLKDLEILGGEGSLSKMDFDGVVRLGGIPTFRFWRDLEQTQSPVWNFSDVPFSGLPRDRQVWSLTKLAHFDLSFEDWNASERAMDRGRFNYREECLQEFPLSEPAWVRRLSEQIPSDARLFLGNSLPIREWDEMALRSPRPDVFANRGVNGIDGMLSTFYGLADANKPNWAVFGDLTVLYDLSGPWALRQIEAPDTTIAIINNGGGKIFERIFRNPLFENRHDLNFESWAKMWRLNYRCVTEVDALKSIGHQIFEILPSNEQTAAFWKKWEQR